MSISLIIITCFVSMVMLFMQTPAFGRLPRRRRRQLLAQSAQYRNGKFQNAERTTVMAEDVHTVSMLKHVLFTPNIRVRPDGPLPSVKEDLHERTLSEGSIVWFGHSSYLLRFGGRNILVDPVFSGSVSPLKVTNRSFAGSDRYAATDMPEIDILIITHDHWDHCDYETLVELRPKVREVVTSLGVGEHLERWGFSPAIIHEMDWWGSRAFGAGVHMNIHCTPARHFSGRGFRRAQTLWSSFVLEIEGTRIFVGGDSGYGSHFVEIGARFGPFDFAILECGQYDPHWRHIHMMPEETVQAALDLGAQRLMPVHWAKFTLSKHPWDDSILRVQAEALRREVTLVHPMIGQAHLWQRDSGNQWWVGVE